MFLHLDQPGWPSLGTWDQIGPVLSFTIRNFWFWWNLVSSTGHPCPPQSTARPACYLFGNGHSPLRKQFFCFHLSPQMSRKILHWLMLGRLLFLLQCSVFLSKDCFLSEGAASLVLRKQGVLTFVCFHVCPEKSWLKGSINNHIGRTSYDFPSPLCIFKCFLEVC